MTIDRVESGTNEMLCTLAHTIGKQRFYFCYSLMLLVVHTKYTILYTIKADSNKELC